MAVDPRKFLLNTDYEMDKIIYFKDGNLNVGDYNVQIPHGLGFTPLVFGVCSFNSDFSDPRSIPYSYNTNSTSIAFNVQADSTNITIGYTNTSGTPAKIYYRLYAFEPSNSTATIAPTNTSAKTFVLNTDYNYCKLYKKGISNGDSTIAHNLGYVPQVLAWEESGGYIVPIDTSTPEDPITNTPTYISVSTSNITTHGYGTVYYRIYYDEE